MLRMSAPAAHRALLLRESWGIITPVNEKKWGRVWEAFVLLNLVEGFERRVASGL